MGLQQHRPRRSEGWDQAEKFICDSDRSRRVSKMAGTGGIANAIDAGLRSSRVQCRSRGLWDDRQQKIRLLTRFEMQTILAAEYGGRTVFRIGMRKRPHPLHRVEFVRQLSVAEAILVVLATDVQCEPVAGGDHDTGRQAIALQA